jgi:hypothetical protein
MLIKTAKINSPKYKKLIGFRDNETNPLLKGLDKTERQNRNLPAVDLFIFSNWVVDFVEDSNVKLT